MDQHEIHEGILFIKEFIVDRTKSDVGDPDFSTFIEFADSLNYTDLVTKGAYNILFKKVEELQVQHELQKVFNQICMVFTPEDTKTLAGTIGRTLNLGYLSDTGSSLSSDVITDDEEAVNGQMDDVDLQLLMQPWYMVTLVALI